MRTPEEVLSDIVVDVSAMRAGEVSFGPFEGCEDWKTGTVVVEWPNLHLLVMEAETILQKRKEQCEKENPKEAVCKCRADKKRD